MQFPPFPQIPEPLRGNSFVLVEAYFLGTEEEGAKLLEPLRELGPVMDTVATVPPVALAEMHMDPPEPVPYLGEHLVLGDLPASAIDDFVAAAGPGSGSSLVSAEIRHTGGALARGSDDHGALNRFPGSFLTFWVGMVLDDASEQKTRADLQRVTASLSAHCAGSYLNFEEDPSDPARFYDADTYRRLRVVKALVDPDELIRANHPILPAR
jgi:hypothetical protein